MYLEVTIMKYLQKLLIKGPFTLHQIFGTARIKMVRVPKKKNSVHSFTLQFFPVLNNFISAFGTRTKLKCSFRIRQQNHFYPVRMRPVLFQNGGWRVSGRVSLQFL